MENLARYIIRASFSQERMTYLSEESKVISTAERRRSLTPWNGWLPWAPMCRDRGEQMVR